MKMTHFLVISGHFWHFYPLKTIENQFYDVFTALMQYLILNIENKWNIEAFVIVSAHI